jgi:hypothetical protein
MFYSYSFCALPLESGRQINTYINNVFPRCTASDDDMEGKFYLLQAECAALKIKLASAEAGAQETCNLIYAGACLLQRYVGWWR